VCRLERGVPCVLKWGLNILIRRKVEACTRRAFVDRTAVLSAVTGVRPVFEPY
jgi:hypothetical protein